MNTPFHTNEFVLSHCLGCSFSFTFNWKLKNKIDAIWINNNIIEYSIAEFEGIRNNYRLFYQYTQIRLYYVNILRQIKKNKSSESEKIFQLLLDFKLKNGVIKKALHKLTVNEDIITVSATICDFDLLLNKDSPLILFYENKGIVKLKTCILMINQRPVLFNEKEIQLLSLISKGKQTNLIASTMYVSSHTISDYKKQILQKTNLKSINQVIAQTQNLNLY